MTGIRGSKLNAEISGIRTIKSIDNDIMFPVSTAHSYIRYCIHYSVDIVRYTLHESHDIAIHPVLLKTKTVKIAEKLGSLF